MEWKVKKLTPVIRKSKRHRMMSSKPEKAMLRSSKAAESVVVDLIDPKFPAFSIVCVDLEGDCEPFAP